MSNSQHSRAGTTTSPLARLERIVDDWFHTLPGRHPSAGGGVPGEEMIPVDEYRDRDTQVVRADVPGIDPERGVDISIADGLLRISVERRVEERTESTGWTRNELRYGTFSRSLPLPDGANRIPVNEPAAAADPLRIPVRKG